MATRRCQAVAAWRRGARALPLEQRPRRVSSATGRRKARGCSRRSAGARAKCRCGPLFRAPVSPTVPMDLARLHGTPGSQILADAVEVDVRGDDACRRCGCRTKRPSLPRRPPSSARATRSTTPSCAAITELALDLADVDAAVAAAALVGAHAFARGAEAARVALGQAAPGPGSGCTQRLLSTRYSAGGSSGPKSGSSAAGGGGGVGRATGVAALSGGAGTALAVRRRSRCARRGGRRRAHDRRHREQPARRGPVAEWQRRLDPHSGAGHRRQTRDRGTPASRRAPPCPRRPRGAVRAAHRSAICRADSIAGPLPRASDLVPAAGDLSRHSVRFHGPATYVNRRIARHRNCHSPTHLHLAARRGRRAGRVASDRTSAARAKLRIPRCSLCRGIEILGSSGVRRRAARRSCAGRAGKSRARRRFDRCSSMAARARRSTVQPGLAQRVTATWIARARWLHSAAMPTFLVRLKRTHYCNALRAADVGNPTWC